VAIDFIVAQRRPNQLLCSAIANQSKGFSCIDE
jgi:hypothetical protein